MSTSRHIRAWLIIGVVDDMVLEAPRLTIDDALSCASRDFGVTGRGSLLPSERDQNVVIQTDGGDRFVLKIANAAESRALLDAQNAALAHVARRSTLCPTIVPAVDGRTIVEVRAAGSTYLVRLFSWIPGVPLADAGVVSTELLEDFGARLAELDAALDGFDHPAIHRDFYWDLARARDIVRESSPLVADESLRRLVRDVASRVDARDGARLARLRRAAVHNDPNDHNVLVSETRTIAGVVDFGDLVHSYAIADLAIAIAYAVLDKPDPLDAAVSIVRGYARSRPLDDDDVASLWGLVLLRLCAS